MRVQSEDYERVYIREEQESPYFEKNYGESWQHLNIHHLRDFAAEDWQNIMTKLTNMHARAYNWTPLTFE